MRCPPPAGAGAMEMPSSQRSSLFPGCEWCHFTTLRPVNTPMAPPMRTSLAQCLLLYMRETPTSVAPPYIAGATYHAEPGHHRRASSVTAAAAAKAVTECPDGKER